MRCVTGVDLVFDGEINRLSMVEEAVVWRFLPYRVTDHQVCNTLALGSPHMRTRRH